MSSGMCFRLPVRIAVSNPQVIQGEQQAESLTLRIGEAASRGSAKIVDGLQGFRAVQLQEMPQVGQLSKKESAPFYSMLRT
jgi:hypothetical protein